MDVKLKHICSLGGKRRFGGWMGKMPVIGQGKNRKVSDICRGFWFSARYSSCLTENTKNGVIHKTLSFRAASQRDPEDAGRKKGVEEGGAGARGGAPESCAGSSEGPLRL